MISVLLLVFAFIGALVVITGLAMAVDRFRVFGEYYIPSFFVLVLFSIASKTVLVGRNLTNYSFDTGSIVGLGSGAADWILRLATLSIVGLSIAAIVDYAFTKHRYTNRENGWAFELFALYCVLSTILCSLFGTVPDFDYRYIYPIVIFYAVSRARVLDFSLLIRVVQYSILISLIAGLILALIKPSMSIQPNYTGLLPVLNFRFWGIDTHPNGLGPLAAFFIILIYSRPLNFKLVNFVAHLVAWSSLILTQSKTSILALAFALAVYYVYRFGVLLAAKTPGQERNKFLFEWFSIVAVVILIICSWLIVEGFGTEWADRRAFERAGELTGRQNIWNVSLTEFYRSPIFGYGMRLWSPEFSVSYGLLGVASNSHNQFVDVVATSGIVGLIGFSAYFVFVVVSGWRERISTNGLSLALVAFMLARSIPEVPFRIVNIQSNDFLIHLFLFALLVCSKRSRVSDKSNLLAG